jgi:sugar O-acyltransferase (sialic acid O-acetyltransferase NeuD family)
MTLPSLILVGGGGHCRSCIDVIEQHGGFRIAGILDLPETVGTSVLGYPIIGDDDRIEPLAAAQHGFLVTLGQIKSPDKRIALFERIKKCGGPLPSIVSPLAHVSCHAYIGEGTIIMHGALVNAGARIGRNCIINSKALVEHDVLVGDHCHVSTACVINGAVTVGEGSFLGSGVVTHESIEIGVRSVVGAGVRVRGSLSARSFERA